MAILPKKHNRCIVNEVVIRRIVWKASWKRLSFYIRNRIVQCMQSGLFSFQSESFDYFLFELQLQKSMLAVATTFKKTYMHIIPKRNVHDDMRLEFDFSVFVRIPSCVKTDFLYDEKKTVMGNTLVLSNKRKILQKDMNLVTVDSSFFSLFNRREFRVFCEVFAQFVSSKKIPFTLFW